MDWTTQHSDQGSLFRSKRYSDFATLSEDLSSGNLQASFILAPMAMSLAQKGVPIKIVYLGHRDGTTLVVGKDSGIDSFADMKGKKILVPGTFSNQRLWMARLCEQYGLKLIDIGQEIEGDVKLSVCPPPDMPAMLQTGSCDGYAVGEPHAARSELAGFGKVLLHVKDSWPNFISCVLVVRQELIDEQPNVVQELVNGISGSGLWLEQGLENRMSAADVAGKYYYNQDPKLLRYVLSTPVDRVRYNSLVPARADLEEIMNYAVKFKLLERPIAFEDYCDPSFSEQAPMKPVPMPGDDQIAVGSVESNAAESAAPVPAAPGGKQ